MKSLLITFFALAGITTPFSVHATLGEKSTSIERDKKTFSTSRKASVTQSLYTIHEISSDGIAIREFEGSDGIIFAVAWKGVSQPDLSALLGSYSSDFYSASKRRKKQPGRRSHNSTSGSKVVVEKFGHMRAARGRAYVPSLMPNGVNPSEIE